MKDISKHNYEEWFFQYFEGLLNKEEKILVLNFIEKDPLYREEFDYWERSYVREPLPEKLKMEDALLKRSPARSYFIYGSILTLVLILAVLYTVLFLKKEEKQINIVKEEKKTTEEKESITPAEEVTNNIKSSKVKNTISITKNISGKPFFTTELNTEPLENIEYKGEISKRSEADTVLIPLSDQSVDTENRSKPQVEIVDKKSRKALSREEKRKQREIEKFKQKALEKKQAEEFLKGKVPYVVPIDPNTF